MSMNNEYYANGTATPGSDFLAHYGVKGMKWGVRKAKLGGDSKALNKQYKKALKKLTKLNTKADINRQRKEAAGHFGNAITGGAAAGIGAGLAYSATKAARGSAQYLPIGAAVVGTHAAVETAKGIAAKRRTTAKGHAKAVAKRNAWKKEMRTAFKGTKYANMAGSNTKTKRINYDSVKDQLKNAAKASLLGPTYAASKQAVNGPRLRKKRSTKPRSASR